MKNIEVILNVSELRDRLHIPLLDDANAIASKLESLNSSQRLNIGAIQGLDDYSKVRKSAMQKKTVKNYYSGGSGYGTFVPYTGATANLDLGANNLIVNTDQLYVDSVSGNVGINTSIPQGKLHIQTSSVGTITPSAGAKDLVIENSGYAGMTIYGGNTAASEIFFADVDNDTIGGISYIHSGDYMSFRTNGLDTMRLTNNGDFGIYTTTPSQRLDVNGNIALSGSIGNSQVAGTPLSIYGSHSDTAYITVKSGSLGIGTDTPSQLLEVSGTDAKALVTGTTGAAIHMQVVSTATTWSEWQKTTTSTRLNINNGTTTITDAMTILDTGNVGIGNVTAPSSKLYVNGTTSFIGNSYVKGLMYIDSNNFGGAPIISFAVGDTDTGLHSTGDGQLNLYSNSVNVMSIRSAGVGIGETSPTSKLQVVGLAVYANNAAAVTGGLTVGAFYRSGGDPDLVCVVH